MTRTRILLALALAAAAVLVWHAPAQTARTTERSCVSLSNDDCFVPRIPRPQNGQCPVCGTMAQPYHLRRSAEGQEAMYLHHLGQHNQRFTICAHCNTVFRQWAEGKEPKR